MLGIVHASFSQDAYELSFSVVLATGKKLQFDSADDLLRHDNTVADPINHLRIQATDSRKSSSCSIFFYGEKQPHLSGVTVKVESEQQRWATSLSAELEEQVERIKMPGLFYRLRQSVGVRNLLTTLLIPIALSAFTIGAFIDLSKISGTQEERREILRLAEAAKSQDEKIDVLVKAQVAALREKSPDSFSSSIRLPSVDAKFVVGLLPVLISLLLLWYLISWCYPPAVFSWGDSGKQFQRLLERRKNLWSILVTVIVLGFLVNVSSPVISSWLGV
jgi:hypothetical protein